VILPEASMASEGIAPCLDCRRQPANSRGLCQRCYSRWAHRVRAGKATWAALEAEGRALPLSPQGEARRRGKQK
jgi:hypothetical protein